MFGREAVLHGIIIQHFLIFYFLLCISKFSMTCFYQALPQKIYITFF